MDEDIENQALLNNESEIIPNKYALEDISSNIPAGKLTGIFGPIASGKSTFLLSIIKEIGVQSGSIFTLGEIVYFAQEPLILHGTLRDNILFGTEYDNVKYIYIYILGKI